MVLQKILVIKVSFSVYYSHNGISLLSVLLIKGNAKISLIDEDFRGSFRRNYYFVYLCEMSIVWRFK